MSTRALTIRPAAAAVSLGALGLTLLICLAMAIDVRFGIVLLAVAVFTAVALIDLTWGVALWIPLGFVAASVPALYAAQTAGTAVLAIAWLGELRRRRRAAYARPLARPLIAALTLLVWVVVSVGWADDVEVAKPIGLSWVCAIAVFAIIATTATDIDRVRLLAAAFLAGAVLSVLVGIATEGLTATGGDTLDVTTGLRAPGGGDANLIAAGLIPALCLAAGLFATTRSLATRAVLAFAVLVLFVGVAQTQSRGAAIGLLAVVVAALVVARRQRVQLLFTIVSVAALAAAVFAVFPGALDRMVTADSTGTGRTELWGVAVEMSRDHPVVGVGLANFPKESQRYVRRPGQLAYVEDIVYRPHVVHNTYLGMLAEGGAIGLVLLLLAIVACVRAAWRAARIFERRRMPVERTMARAVLLGAIGMLTANVFVSDGHDPRLWVLLALGPALLAAALPPRRPAG